MISPAWNPPCFGAGRRIKGLPPPPGAASQRGHRTWMWMRWEDGLSITWRAVVAGLEAATAMCALLNLAYFLHRVISVDSPTRRAAALVLALLSLGTLAESIAVMASLETTGHAPPFAPAAWVVARTISLAGTGFISALILKAIGDRK